MEPKGTQQPNVVRTDETRKTDPRWWAMLPVIALLILGAYYVGKRNSPPPASSPAPVAAPTVAPPPALPKGKVTVTEVPPVAATPVPVPAPVATPPTLAPAPSKAAKQPAYRQVEPPVVLPKDSEPPTVTPDDHADTAGDSSDSSDSSSDVDRDPVKMNDPAQEYPASAYNDGVQGTAKVGFTISTEGTVSEAHVTQSSGDNRLDDAAVDYVKRLKFRPALRHGRPAEVRANRNVVFQLSQ
ncbi:MAG TPA: energy transducer TonB [Armatimonadota bacterium]|jgi:protein TonB